MITFQPLFPGSFQVSMNNPSKLSSPDVDLSECNDETCIFTRSKTTIRENMEDMIQKFCHGKKNLIVLSYHCYLLLQEKKLLEKIGKYVAELHLFDTYYEDHLKDTRVQLAIQALVKYAFFNHPHLKIFVHTKMNNLLKFTKNKFDVLYGIDMETSFNDVDHGPIIRKIAETILRFHGQLFLSQKNILDVKVNLAHFCKKQNLELIKEKRYTKNILANKTKIFFFPVSNILK